MRNHTHEHCAKQAARSGHAQLWMAQEQHTRLEPLRGKTTGATRTVYLLESGVVQSVAARNVSAV